MIVRPRTVTICYRVGDLVHVYGMDYSHPGASLRDVREFKTYKAAERYGAEIDARGGNALLQMGVLQWMTPEAAADVFHGLLASDDVEIDGN